MIATTIIYLSVSLSYVRSLGANFGDPNMSDHKIGCRYFHTRLALIASDSRGSGLAETTASTCQQIHQTFYAAYVPTGTVWAVLCTNEIVEETDNMI